MASVRQLVESRLEQIEQTVQELRDQLDEGEFDDMTATTDKIGEQADQLAQKLQQVHSAIGDDDQQDDQEQEQTGGKKRGKRNASEGGDAP